MRCSLACLLVLSALVFANEGRGQDRCPADPTWLTGTDLTTAEPSDPLTNDCGFYQRSWQAFLSVTKPDGERSRPRFVGFDNVETLRRTSPPKVGPFAASLTGRMSVALRLAKEQGPFFHEGVSQADGSILVDRTGRPVFYAIHVDPKFASFIRDNGLNDPAKLADPALDPELTPGSIELKSAWVEVAESAPPSSFILADAAVPTLVQSGDEIVADPSKPRSVKLAMIGLHVVFALENHPEMIWATFEHITAGEFDLAPSAKALPTDLDPSQPISGRDYLLYSAGTTASAAMGPPDRYKLDPSKQTLSPGSPTFRRFPWSQQPDPKDPGAALEEDDMVKSINEEVAKLFSAGGKVDLRSNYKLVGAVWLTRGAADLRAGVKIKDAQLSGETGLSNMAMESFTQQFNPNCFGCHQPLKIRKVAQRRANVSHIMPKFSD